MDVVLEAERGAQAELDACRRDADAIMAQARETSRYIQHRTQERITRLHQACEEKTADRIEALRRRAIGASADSGADSPDEVMIREAAARLAARLTGSEDDRR